MDARFSKHDAIHGTSNIDLAALQPWSGWCVCQRCLVCGVDCDPACELVYYYLGADGKADKSQKQYIKETCVKCTQKLLKRDPLMHTQAYWDGKCKLYYQLANLDVIDSSFMESIGLKPPKAVVKSDDEQQASDGVAHVQEVEAKNQ